jgi:polar amino acid transport system substrate-binding protein
MKVKLAYIEEPPFGWTEPSQIATGADVELAATVLYAVGVTQIKYHLTTFNELLPGVQAGRWDMNVPLFVTRARSAQVTFSRPVWAISDGFLVRAGNPKSLNSYESFKEQPDACLGIIIGQVQLESALASGVHMDRVVLFRTQPEAVDALRLGHIDAYASTAVGNRVLSARLGGVEFEAVAHALAPVGALKLPVGAYSFNKSNVHLASAFNVGLQKYLGSSDHRTRMARYGLTAADLDPVLAI